MFAELCRIEKQFASLNIINSEEAIKVLDLLEKNIEKRDTLITNLKTEIATKWKKGLVVEDVDIINCGNYYIGHFLCNYKHINKAYVVWDKNGNVYNVDMEKLFR